MNNRIPFLAVLGLVLIPGGFIWMDRAKAPSAPPPIYPHDRVSMVSPLNGSDISGRTTLSICAPGLLTARVNCWKQGWALGADSIVGTIGLDDQGGGFLIFPADEYPHGPITLRIAGTNGRIHDNYYLQVYNKGGVSWNEGIPKTAPPAARDMSLVFAEDFHGPLSISGTDSKATYYDHKPGGGDFGAFHFADFNSAKNPFAQIDTYLRIRADARTKSDGLISSLKNDGVGFKVGVPCYFECRLLAPSEPGTWPAFWLMTDYMENGAAGASGPADEFDVMEGYGGEGPHNPNSKGEYRITSHFWNQGRAGRMQKGLSQEVPLRFIGTRSSWWETFHTYGCKITETDTLYYCDDMEVGRHPTGALSKHHPLFFLINLAIGGNGWPVNLTRYNGVADMYVDYIRVYHGSAR